ncbi:phenylacetic acid degradation protein PaaI [Streptomyces scopuliridis RB72]|uniref:Phenylacetic acid degradation protein PaaI n=2 Tax=Streptomyces scopuliridis TaxID=452529 RepID=A0A2T7TBK7_9ACTN|nr:PaaI family thioesterase [Streptomyces scopuliridis]PVE12472.1 phenylacetic acid degradation protein PaaI [Streptomyces scopuliridis RB72]
MENPARQEQVSPEVRDRVRASFERQGLMGHLGARLAHIAPGRVHIVLPGRPEVTQQHGYFHAGATSAIADSAGGYAAFTLFPENTSVLTVEYKINLLAPAEGDHIEAVGTVVRSGRTLTVCQLEVFGVEDVRRTLVATGQQTLIRVNGNGNGNGDRDGDRDRDRDRDRV